MAKAAQPIPHGFHTLTPQLVLENAAQTIDWYKKAFGAVEVTRALAPDGKVIHAELRIGDSVFMANDAMMGGKSPKTLGGSPASLWIYVPDCDALFNQAVGAGAQVGMPLTDQFWGDRSGSVVDPSGYQWNIATHKEDLTREEVKQRQDAFFKQMSQPAHT
jgi:PhnB protein